MKSTIRCSFSLAADYASVGALEEDYLVQIEDFHTNAAFGPHPALRRYGLQPPANGEPATSLVRLPAVATSERIGISYRFSGVTQTYRLESAHAHLIGPLAGLDRVVRRALPLTNETMATLP